MYVHKTRPAAVEEVPGKDPSSPVSELLRQKFRAFFPTHVDDAAAEEEQQQQTQHQRKEDHNTLLSKQAMQSVTLSGT